MVLSVFLRLPQFSFQDSESIEDHHRSDRRALTPHNLVKDRYLFTFKEACALTLN
jgi:hypothetical protein